MNNISTLPPLLCVACQDDGLRHRVLASSPSEVNTAEQIAGTNNKFTWQVDTVTDSKH